MWVIATRDARAFLDAPAIELLTGHPVSPRRLDAGALRDVPDAHAVIVCPATFNTVNKIAAGISDSLALHTVATALGRATALVVAPALDSAQARHPAFSRSVEELRAVGAAVLLGPGRYEPAAPGLGSRPYPFDLVMHALTETYGHDEPC